MFEQEISVLTVRQKLAVRSYESLDVFGDESLHRPWVAAPDFTFWSCRGDVDMAQERGWCDGNELRVRFQASDQRSPCSYGYRHVKMWSGTDARVIFTQRQ